MTPLAPRYCFIELLIGHDLPVEIPGTVHGVNHIDVGMLPHQLAAGQFMDDVRGILEKSGLDFAGIKGQGWGLPFDPGAGKRLAPEKVAFPGRMFTCAATLGVITLLPDKPCHLSMASVLARYGLKWPRQLFGLMRKGRDDPSSPAGWKYPRAGRSATSMINDNVPCHGTYKGWGKGC